SSSFFICSASTALAPFRGFVLLSFCTRLSLACDYIIEHLLYNVKHNSADFQHFPAIFHEKKPHGVAAVRFSHSFPSRWLMVVPRAVAR
ncbi:hypothetical protein, partial [Gemmiger formicilis]